MKQFFSSLLFFLLIGSAQAQLPKSEAEYNRYADSLKTGGVDTILVLRSGCIGCHNHPDSAKFVADKQTIYVLTQHRSKYILAEFDNVLPSKTMLLDTCSIFRFIGANQSLLSKKKEFYRKESQEINKKLLIPIRLPNRYSYEDLSINFPDFQYYLCFITEDFNIPPTDHNYSPMITTDTHFYSEIQLGKEPWFNLTKNIIANFYSNLKSIQK